MVAPPALPRRSPPLGIQHHPRFPPRRRPPRRRLQQFQPRLHAPAPPHHPLRKILRHSPRPTPAPPPAQPQNPQQARLAASEVPARATEEELTYPGPTVYVYGPDLTPSPEMGFVPAPDPADWLRSVNPEGGHALACPSSQLPAQPSA